MNRTWQLIEQGIKCQVHEDTFENGRADDTNKEVKEQSTIVERKMRKSFGQAWSCKHESPLDF